MDIEEVMSLLPKCPIHIHRCRQGRLQHVCSSVRLHVVPGYYELNAKVSKDNANIYLVAYTVYSVDQRLKRAGAICNSVTAVSYIIISSRDASIDRSATGQNRTGVRGTLAAAD